MLTDLADVVRASGLRVVEEPGWRTRAHGPMAGVLAVVCHHTAGPRTGDAPSLATVRDGRPDLRGPLAQLLLARSGTVHVVAAGLSWHTGTTFQPWQGNASAIGIEAEATGRDPWPPAQYDAYVRLCRALADRYGVPLDRVVGHKEIARPAGRKSDPNFDMAAFRAAVTRTGAPMADFGTPVRNYQGDLVTPAQIIVATEQRVAALQNEVAVLQQKLDRVLDLLAARTGS